MTTTTFRQYLGDIGYWVEVPLGRVEGLLEKIDKLTDMGFHKKAFQLLEKYIVADRKAEDVTIPVLPKKDRKVLIAEFLAERKGTPQAELISLLRTAFDLSYSNARYYVVR